MTKIITENFKVENTNELYGSFIGTDSLVTSGFDNALLAYSNNFAENDLTGALTSDQQSGIKELLDRQIAIYGSSAEYYIVASSYDTDPTINNSQFSKREFQRRVIFGNKVPVDDVRYMFDAPLWISGTVYDDFDDAEDISSKNLFVHVVDGAQVTHIFKCLENSNDGASKQAPSLTLDAAGDAFIHVISGDGYVWHYMFSVTENEKVVFSTENTLPFPAPGNTDVIERAKEDISQIKITNTISNLFSEFVFGTTGNTANVSNVTVESNGVDVVIDAVQFRQIIVDIQNPNIELVEQKDSYTQLYLWSSASSDPLYEVLGSERISRTSMSLNIKATTFDIAGKNFKLVPKINISQSGGTQALAYGIIDKDGTLVKIGYKNRGSGYKYATATLALPGTSPVRPYGTLGPQPNNIFTTLRCIVSPTGGHGSNPINEMAMSKLAVITNFSGTSKTVPDSNTYTKVGLIKNPSFVYPSGTSAGQILDKRIANPDAGFDNRLILTLTSPSGVEGQHNDGVAVGDRISQVSSTSEGDETVTAIIHEVEYDSFNQKTFIYLVDYDGAFTSKFTTGEVDINGTTKYINTSNAIYGNYLAYSGEVLHFLDFDPITRDSVRKEKIKFIFDF